MCIYFFELCDNYLMINSKIVDIQLKKYEYIIITYYLYKGKTKRIHISGLPSRS